MTFREKREAEATELEAIQQKLINNQPLTKQEREECYWGLYGRINALRDIHPEVTYKRLKMVDDPTSKHAAAGLGVE